MVKSASVLYRVLADLTDVLRRWSPPLKSPLVSPLRGRDQSGKLHPAVVPLCLGPAIALLVTTTLTYEYDVCTSISGSFMSYS